jgi:hypothetical protein
MSPETSEGRAPVEVEGPQEIRNNVARVLFPDTKVAPVVQNHSPTDRRTPTTGLSVAVHECRKNVALDDIWRALSPVSRHTDAAMLCLELDDFVGLEHHLGCVVDGVRKAGAKHKELRALLAKLGRETAQ